MDGGRHDHLNMQERRPQAVSKTVDSWRVSRLNCRDELMTLIG